MSMLLTRPEEPVRHGLFAGYSYPPGTLDEMFAAPEQIRPHWQDFAQRLSELGPEELCRRWEQAGRMVYEHGVTYNATGDGKQTARPWELDAVPLLLAGKEWEQLADGLKQRATLYNRLLADLYGPQTLLQQGIIPPELVFSHPGFLRACHGLSLPENCWLHLYAAEIARGTDGGWWVMGDRTRSPSGTGYALENRIVTSRSLPHLFHTSRVERIASFFIALRETLHKLAPRFKDNPRIVLLSQGPGSPYFFEDAYLARYLNYALVQGGDLAVRNNRVMLKTLGGLLPVEVILRRVADEDCDPLELRGDSPYGIAGLMEAVRSGNVAIANAIGSGVAESPAFLPFLPAICRALLHTDLMLPSVPTWWCGDPSSLSHVLEHLPRLIIRRAFRQHESMLVSADDLPKKSVEELRQMIRARPAEFVAQEPPVRSTTPVWLGSRMKSWALSLKVFLAAHGDTYVPLPGGLVRVAPDPRMLDRTMSAGERSQDAWVLSEGPIQEVSLLKQQGQNLELRRSGAELPSRVADNLFWLGRHAERAEGAARLLRTVFLRLTSEVESRSLPEIPVLLRMLATQGHIEASFAVAGMQDPLPAIEQALPAAVFDEQEQFSLRATVIRLHAVASIVRDRISIDIWRILHNIHESFRMPRRRGHVNPTEVLGMLNQLILELSAFTGLVMENMTRTQGWRLLDLGRRIDRALHRVALVQTGLVNPPETEPPVLESLLEIADSLMTYRTRYLASLQFAPAIDLLLTDETNPRSLAYQLVVIAEHVENLPRDRLQPALGAEQRLAMSLLHDLRMADVYALNERGANGLRTGLDRLLSRLANQLPQLSQAISHKYLIHSGAPRQLAEQRSESGG